MRPGAVLLGVSLLFCAFDAGANGRFPRSQRLIQDHEHPERFYLAATFGVLVSENVEQGFFYLCEQAFSAEAKEADPLLQLLPGGGLLAGVVQPLSRSSDCGCGWEPVLGLDDRDWVLDLTRGGDDTLLAVVRSAGPPIRYRLERSSDAGRTWSRFADLPPGLEDSAPPPYDVLTVDIAPSNPDRVYLSVLIRPDLDAGVELATPAIARSDDAGVSFEVTPIAAAGNEDYPYIAAVHPTNADALYVRSDDWTEDTDLGIDVGNDALFYSDDAGASFREVLRRGGKLFGFALAPDGATVLAGYGDPVIAAAWTYAEELGIYRADATVLEFEHVLNAAVSCLTWNDNGLYACFEEQYADLDAPFGVGHSPDGSVPATIGGFMPILRFADVRGPLACHTACLDDWQTDSETAASACARLGAECEVDAASNVLACESGSGGLAGSAGSGAAGAPVAGSAGDGSSGAGAAGASAGTAGIGAGGSSSAMGGVSGAVAGSESRSESSSKSNCGCRTVGYTSASFPFMLLGLIATSLALRRREFRLSTNFPQWRALNTD